MAVRASGALTLPASFCGFKIRVSFPVNKEYSKILNTTNGSMTTLSTGASTVSNTNVSTGKTITVNPSGPEKVTTFADGSETLRAKGRSAYALSPADARRFGLPRWA